MRLNIAIPQPTFSKDDLLTPFVELLPLPPEQYPRIIDQRRPDKGYYIALGIIYWFWSITPGSAVYLVWYGLSGRHLLGKRAVILAIVAIWASIEIVFAAYHWYLVHYVQMPSPPSTLPLEIRHSLFHKVLHNGLSYSAPERPTMFPFQDTRSPMNPRNQPETYDSPTTTTNNNHLKPGDQMGMERALQGERIAAMERAGFKPAELWLRDWTGASSSQRRSSMVEFAEVDTPISSLSDQEPMEDAYGNPIMLHAHDRRAIEFRERMRTWFNHAPWSSLRRQNVLMWLSWSCFGLPLEDVCKDPDHVKYLNKTIRFLEARTGMPIPEGYDPKVEVLRLTLDPVIARGRPFLLYALSNSINIWLKHIWYPFQGMSFCKEGDIEYLVRIPEGWTPDGGQYRQNAVPIVYLHGLGFGLLQSHLLIKHLIRSLPSHPLIIPLAPYTSQSIFHRRHLKPWSRPEFVSAMKKICTKWGFWEEGQDGQEDHGGVSLMSHSNGSVAHGWILKDCPGMTRRNTFIDPVVFCLWEGDVCHSFCYRKPVTPLELLLYYFIASEIGIANYIQRHFDWADNTLFFDEIPNGTDPRKTAFFFGAQDIIIDAARTRKYLESHGVTRGLHWDPDQGHGDGLRGDSRHRIVMYVGTGSTRGWEGWVEKGRFRHSVSVKQWAELETSGGSGNEVEPDSGPTTAGLKGAGHAKGKGEKDRQGEGDVGKSKRGGGVLETGSGFNGVMSGSGDRKAEEKKDI